MFTATVKRPKAKHLSPLLIALAAGMLLVSSTPNPGSDLPAQVEVVEKATESFANAMLDLGLALRDGAVTEFEAAIAPHLEAVPPPREAEPTSSVHGWVLRHGWQLEAKPTEISRNTFVDHLEAFLDQFSEVEDVRLKVKKSRVTGRSIECEVALAIVARDASGRRAWTRGRATVRSTRSDNDLGWTIDRFVITSLNTMIAAREVFSEVALPAGVARTDPPFLARRGPPFAAYGAAVGDIDRDGLFDVVVTSEAGNSLYLNRGNGTFDDAATGSRVRDVHGDIIAPLLLDVDNDGDLDLFLAAVGDQMLFENRLVPDGDSSSGTSRTRAASPSARSDSQPSPATWTATVTRTSTSPPTTATARSCPTAGTAPQTARRISSSSTGATARSKRSPAPAESPTAGGVTPPVSPTSIATATSTSTWPTTSAGQRALHQRG